MPEALSPRRSLAPTPLVVLKFGSSLLKDPDGYRVAAAEVARELERDRRVVSVVSAMGDATDRLLGAATSLSDTPDHSLLATLLRTGEDASVAMLAIALMARGLPVQAVDGHALRLRTTGPLNDAEPIAIDADRFVAWLGTGQAVVVPGFVGRDISGPPSLLGRGGSDLTALFLASELGAEEVRLVKDVDGVHPRDPRSDPGTTQPLESADWSEVDRIGNGVVQTKALRFARRRGIRFRVAAPGGRGTLVGPAPPREGRQGW